MPERAELWRKTGQKGLLIASYKRPEKDSDRAITPAKGAVCVPAHLALPGSPGQAAVPPSRSTLTGAELPHAKKKKILIQVCRVT